MRDWLDDLSSAEREALRESPHPDRMSPLLATLTEERFSEPAWIFEPRPDSKLRHPRLFGLRRDKKPHKVTREMADD